ncbi:MAG: EAL domain-containing protein [Terrimicrobiaceae bacterium]|nr:EAL domain-containing protein [Terrimicrobiaceae bacterium]
MRILLIEDDRSTGLLLRRAFEKRGHEVSLHESAESGWEAIRKEWFPAAFLDINLPGKSGLDVARQIRALPEGERCYILVGTGETGPEILEKILAAGADDYIAKPFLASELNVRMAVAEKRVAEIASLREAQQELTFLARHDPLTRLWNRRELVPAIERTAQSGMLSGTSSILLLDLDHFKEVNDLFGHQAGDRLLVDIAEILKKELPPTSWIIRYGGDEFVAVLPGVPPAQAVDLAEGIIAKINTINYTDDPEAVRPGGSVGIAEIASGILPEQIIKRADAACYRAKSQGKNRAEVFVEFDTRLLRSSQKKKAHPAKGGPESSLQLYFQPICDLETGKIFFQEALLRFLGPSGVEGIKAAMFLSQITDRAYVRSLDQFVTEEICVCLKNFPDLIASVNISASSLSDWHFAQNLEHLLLTSGIPGQRLILEITETQAIEDFKMAQTVVRKIREMGVRLALDDFGTGFSSLTSLKKLPADLVKLDGDLTRQVEDETFSQVMIDAVKVMSKGIGFATVAERIERVSDLRFAQSHGIGYGQGYLLGRPRPEPWRDEEIPRELFQNRKN